MTALPAGYATNVIIGGLLIFAGFNTLASKVSVFAPPSTLVFAAPHTDT